MPQWVIDNQRKREVFERGTQVPASSIPVTVSRRLLRRPGTDDGTISAETIERLRPPKYYLDRYANFLRNKGHGIFRIFPDQGCDEGLTVSVESLEKCGTAIPVKGSGSLFSFRTRTSFSPFREFWDVHFIDGKLVGGNSSVQVFLAETDVSDLNKITSKHSAFKALAKYEPKSSKTDIRTDASELKKGILIDGHGISNQIKSTSEKVISARVVAYFEKERATHVSNSRFDGKGLDLLLAFQIVGLEPDGSLIILWRELKRDLPRRKLSE